MISDFLSTMITRIKLKRGFTCKRQMPLAGRARITFDILFTHFASHTHTHFETRVSCPVLILANFRTAITAQT